MATVSVSSASVSLRRRRDALPGRGSRAAGGSRRPAASRPHRTSPTTASWRADDARDVRPLPGADRRRAGLLLGHRAAAPLSDAHASSSTTACRCSSWRCSSPRWCGQAIAGHADFNEDQLRHGRPDDVARSLRRARRRSAPRCWRTGSRSTCSSRCSSWRPSGCSSAARRSRRSSTRRAGVRRGAARRAARPSRARRAGRRSAGSAGRSTRTRC